ncbi:hypothetical protein ACWC9T_40865 [Kitasatospora sp. NPDC001159]
MEAKNLARLLADVIADGPRTPQELVDALRRTFDLDTIALLRPTPTGWHTEAATNDRAPSSPDEAPFSAELADGRILVMAGDRLTSKDAQLLREFATQLRLTQERTQLGRLDDA